MAKETAGITILRLNISRIRNTEDNFLYGMGEYYQSNVTKDMIVVMLLTREQKVVGTLDKKNPMINILMSA